MVWQLERRYTVWSKDWYPPFLPHDGQKGCTWVTLEGGRYEPHSCIDPSLSRAAVAKSSTPPIPVLKVFGQRRPCTWDVEERSDTDEDGWQYAVDFYLNPASWSKTLG